MRIPMGWLIVVLALPAPLAAQQAVFTALTYSWSLPMGDTHDFIDNDSWLGFNFEVRRPVRENMSVGLLVGWNEFYETTNETLTFPGGAASGGAQYRHIGMLPIMLNGHYYLGEPGRIRPFIGLNAGVYYMRQLLNIGLSEFTGEEWLFGLAPEAGVAIPVRSGGVFLLSARYHIPANGNEFIGGDQSFQSLSINVGVAYNR